MSENISVGQSSEASKSSQACFLSRRKWIVGLFTLVGLLTAIGYYFAHPPLYQSRTKLLVRFMVDTRTTGLQIEGYETTSLDNRGEHIMNSEIEIFRSFDLALQVATNVGPEKILPNLGGGTNFLMAAEAVWKGTVVDNPKGSSILRVLFSHPDAEVVQPVLKSLTEAYLTKHSEVHLNHEVRVEVMRARREQLRVELSQTEADLREVCATSGIISVEDSKKSMADLKTRLSEDLMHAEAQLAEAKTSLGSQRSSDPASVSSLQTKIDFLTAKLNDLKKAGSDLIAAEMKIIELQRKKDRQEASLSYYQSSLEQAAMDEALGPGKPMNIAVIESPCPPYATQPWIGLILFGLVVGGLVVGLAVSALMDLMSCLKRQASLPPPAAAGPSRGDASVA